MGRIDHYVWERDESSRTEETPAERREPKAGTVAGPAITRSDFSGIKS